MRSEKVISVAVIGTGQIGTDLVERLLRDKSFSIEALVGRRSDSPGLMRFSDSGIRIVSNGIGGLDDFWDEIDGVFDATSASSHLEVWPLIQSKGKWAIDLTPSRVGKPFVPVLSGRTRAMQLDHSVSANYSMVTCGGQSSSPLVFAMSQYSQSITEVEVSSSIASLSAGPATRNNLDEYVDATEKVTKIVTGCPSVKSILVLNPAEPPVMMRTTVTIRAEEFDLAEIRLLSHELVRDVQSYVPGYDLVVEPHITPAGDLSATVKVEGSGYYLPTYSGNLDIINAAAVETARRHCVQGAGI